MALSPKDKVEVATALKTISTKWYSIGLQLGVPVYRLERIDASRWKSADCLMEVVEKWLAQKDGKQTWRALVEALRAQSVGEGKLAMRLERKHCSTDPLAALELGVTKLGTILEAVYSAKSKWYSLGLVLQVPVVILEEIRSQYPDDENCLREVLKFWLKRADPTPTWSALAKALGSKEVRENRLAMGLKFKYCFTEDLLDNVSSPHSRMLFRLTTVVLVTLMILIAHMMSLSILMQRRCSVNEQEITSQYRAALQDIYLSRGGMNDFVWPYIRTVDYTPPTFIKLDPSNTFTRETITGSLDEVLHEKVTTTFVDLFQFEQGSSGARILVEGRPGSGKTTFVQKVSKEWAKGNILHDCTILLAVPLHSLASKNRIEPLDILYFYFPPSFPEVGIFMNEGRGICFVFDGIDEHLGAQSLTGFVSSLFAKKILQESCVIATSRPAATTHLRKSATIYVEILGFTAEQLQQYIISHYYHECHPEKSVQLLNYLETHPNVMNMGYLPININIIFFLYRFDSSLPDTETEIYFEFTKQNLLRFVYRADSEVDCVIHSLYTLKEDCPGIQENFISICQLAFWGKLKDKIIFEERELPSNISSGLGLLTEDRIQILHGLTRTYSFLHSMLQEFLAAFYITTLVPKEQVKEITKNITIGMTEVLKFYAGLTKFKSSSYEIFKFLLQKRTEIQSATKRGSQLNTSHMDIRTLDSTLLCCIFEAQSVKASQELVEQLRGVVEPNPLHLIPLALGFTLANNNQSVRKLHLHSYPMGPAGLSAVLQQLTVLSGLETLELSFTHLKDTDVELLGRLLSRTPNLFVLNLEHNKLQSYGVLQLLPVLKQLHHLEEFGLAGIDLDDQGAVGIADAFADGSWPMLKVLSLDFNLIGDMGLAALATSLKNHLYLEQLWLRNNIFGDEGVVHLARALGQFKSSKLIDVTGNNFTESGRRVLQETAETLQHHFRLLVHILY